MGADTELQLALGCSDLAAGLALTHFRAGVQVSAKRDGTPVTEADRAVERLLRDRLAAARPDDALLGEELGRLGDSERVWILDPIDGTSSFCRRDPHWRVHIALGGSGPARSGRRNRSGARPPVVGDPRRWRVRVVVAATR